MAVKSVRMTVPSRADLPASVCGLGSPNVDESRHRRADPDSGRVRPQRLEWTLRDRFDAQEGSRIGRLPAVGLEALSPRGGYRRKKPPVIPASTLFIVLRREAVRLPAASPHSPQSHRVVERRCLRGRGKVDCRVGPLLNRKPCGCSCPNCRIRDLFGKGVRGWRCVARVRIIDRRELPATQRYPCCLNAASL